MLLLPSHPREQVGGIPAIHYGTHDIVVYRPHLNSCNRSHICCYTRGTFHKTERSPPNGEVASAGGMQVTVKTLRHYEQKGLLVPDEVDEWTGNIAQATSMEPGTKKTQRNGSLSFRYQSNNQSLSAIPELRSPTRSLSLSWGRH